MYRLIVIFLSVMLLIPCASSDDKRMDNIPMYGQPEIPRPEFIKKADEDFINKLVSEVGDRKKASTMWWRQGDKYLREGNFDYAMRRYNQSWLLSPNNYQPYWGFARAMLQLGKTNEALKFFKKASKLIDDDYQKVALLSDTGAAYSFIAKNNTNKNDKEKLYKIANEHFSESTTMDASYSTLWLQWAFSLYDQGEFEKAKEKYNKAKSLGASVESFQNKLESKESE